MDHDGILRQHLEDAMVEAERHMEAMNGDETGRLIEKYFKSPIWGMKKYVNFMGKMVRNFLGWYPDHNQPHLYVLYSRYLLGISGISPFKGLQQGGLNS